MLDALPTLSPEAASHLVSQQCSRQWRSFLRALADEFASALPPADLRALMQRMGLRFAQMQSLSRLSTLDDLQSAMNTLWQAQDWGHVSLSQEADELVIRHTCTPLAAAFGVEQQAWICGFLEGVYQQWFDDQGAGGLIVTQRTELDAWGSVEFKLAR